MTPLTQQQARALAIIRRANETGSSPSYDEIRISLGLASKNGVHRLVTALEERGAIRRLPGRVRALEAIDDLEAKSTAELRRQRDRIDRILMGRSQ